tara:strand:+ start:79 stop:249 length:171 start_codon:yes stop_codon:yes gene_type:complete
VLVSFFGEIPTYRSVIPFFATHPSIGTLGGTSLKNQAYRPLSCGTGQGCDKTVDLE